MKYPLLPYSQLVFDMLKTNPDVYYTRFGLRVDKRKVDVARLRYAVETALRNHPALSMRVDEEGMQEYEPLADIMHGQYHSVDFCDEGENVHIDVAYNRILGDSKSELMVFEDVCRAYRNLPLLQDLYLDYLQRTEEEKRSYRYNADREWLEHEFGAVTYPVHPKTDEPLNTNCIPVEGTLPEDYSVMQKGIESLKRERLIPLTALFSIASAMAIMEYNGTDEAALTWAYEGREKPEEQRVYGSLHRDVPFRLRKSQIDNHESAIRLARKQYRVGIAHSTYPFTLIHPHTDIWNYALNVIVRPTVNDMKEKVPFPFQTIPSADEPVPAYALLDMEIMEQTDSLHLRYRYSATHYKPESIRRFAALVRKYVEWLID